MKINRKQWWYSLTIPLKYHAFASALNHFEISYANVSWLINDECMPIKNLFNAFQLRKCHSKKKKKKTWGLSLTLKKISILQTNDIFQCYEFKDFMVKHRLSFQESKLSRVSFFSRPPFQRCLEITVNVKINLTIQSFDADDVLPNNVDAITEFRLWTERPIQACCIKHKIKIDVYKYDRKSKHDN